jgi:hypothetical protein
VRLVGCLGNPGIFGTGEIMQCYVHSDAAAIGVCKCCAKGVCHTCAIPITNGLACSATCKPTAEALSQLQLTSLRNASIFRAQRSIQLIGVIGLVAFGSSILYSDKQSMIGWVVLAMGALIGISILISLRRQK